MKQVHENISTLTSSSLNKNECKQYAIEEQWKDSVFRLYYKLLPTWLINHEKNYIKTFSVADKKWKSISVYLKKSILR